MNKLLFVLITVLINFNQYFSQSNLIWESNGNGGKKSIFTKLNDIDWIENDGLTSYYYTQVKSENNEYMLSDKNRSGVFIFLKSNACYYKDKNTDWVIIYYGKWEKDVSKTSTANSSINSKRNPNCTSGDCENGEGTYIYSNVTYWGGWKNGQKNGYGTLRYVDMQLYEGNWVNDKMNGFGIFYFSNGDRYEGNWINGIRSGQGTYFFNNGDRFVGTFANGQKTENGTYSYSVEKKGCVSGDCSNGYGKKVFTNSTYEGNFKNGKENGQGKMISWNKSIYEGSFLDGQKHGKGIFTWANGDQYIGDWVNGYRTGSGTYIWGKGKFEDDKYEGAFYNNSRTGWGKYTYAKTGKIEEGNWESDVFKGSEIERTSSSSTNQENLTNINSSNSNFSFVKIGSHDWLTKNLDVTTFRNGDPIFYAKNEQEIISAALSKKPAYTIDPNYGTKLYNWYAVNDIRGLTPDGLAIAKFEHFSDLFKSIPDKKDLMKIGEWENTKATDKFGFSASPCGYFSFSRGLSEAHFECNTTSYFWLSDIEIPIFNLKPRSDYDPAHSRMIKRNSLDLDYWAFDKGCMLSVRCVKGMSNSYVGEMKDGKPNGYGEMNIGIATYFGKKDEGIILGPGESYKGYWKDGAPHGEGILYRKNYDKSISRDSSLFNEGVYLKWWTYVNNSNQKCLNCGVKNANCILKNSKEIGDEKKVGFIFNNSVINLYKCSYYCSTKCEENAKLKEIERNKKNQEDNRNISNSNSQSKIYNSKGKYSYNVIGYYENSNIYNAKGVYSYNIIGYCENGKIYSSKGKYSYNIIGYYENGIFYNSKGIYSYNIIGYYENGILYNSKGKYSYNIIGYYEGGASSAAAAAFLLLF